MARSWTRVALLAVLSAVLVRCGGRSSDAASTELALKCLQDLRSLPSPAHVMAVRATGDRRGDRRGAGRRT